MPKQPASQSPPTSMRKVSVQFSATVPTMLEPGSHPLATILAGAVVAQPCFVRDIADEDVRDAAIIEHGSDELEIDDETCISASPNGTGTWVQAWVWVRTNDEEEAEESDDIGDVRNAPTTSPEHTHE
jgi:hypothetical protein